jgi:hypothetical protein
MRTRKPLKTRMKILERRLTPFPVRQKARLLAFEDFLNGQDIHHT